MKTKPLQIDTVHQCNSCWGNETLHPLVSLIRLSTAPPVDRTIKFNFYTILMIENECTDFIYGRRHYDYSNATLLFLPPGEPLRLDTTRPCPANDSLRLDVDYPLSQKGWLLAFHPHLLCGTTLHAHLDCYPFFSYTAEEALHLSQREATKVTECLSQIDQELRHSIDRHSRTIISRHIELLLDYCARFYERQFITRCEANKELLARLDTLLNDYIHSGKLLTHPQPTAHYCASKLHLSPRYFIDLLHFETGKTIDLYFQLKRIEAAKEMLLCNDKDVEQISEWLGFPSVPHFSKLFQKLTGVAPSEYRMTRN